MITDNQTEQTHKEIVNKTFFTDSDGDEIALVEYSDGEKEYFVLGKSEPEPPKIEPEPPAPIEPPKPPQIAEISKMKVPFGYVRAANVNGKKEIQRMTGVNEWQKITASEARYLVDMHSSSFGSFLKRHAEGTDLEKIFNSLW